MKKLLISVFLGAVAGLSFVQYFDRNLSTDINFFRHAAEQSDRWAAKLRETDAPCHIICGSSDVRMGVDPATMQEEGIRAINASYNAGYGQNLLTVNALKYAKKGDTVVYAPLATGTPPDNQLTGSMKLGFIRHGFHLFETDLVEYSPGNITKILTGDIVIINLYTIKKLTAAPTMYRYNEKTCKVHESGWVELLPVLYWKDLYTSKYTNSKPLPISKYTRNVDIFALKCKERGVDFILRLSVRYGNESTKALNAGVALQYLKAGYKVVKEPDLGVETDINLMADTGSHLSAEGARKHSRILARALKEGAFWTEEELVQEMQKRGWNADGTPIPAQEAPAEAGQAE